MKNVFLPLLTFLLFVLISYGQTPTDKNQTSNTWQTPPSEIMDVLHAPQLPWVWTSPTGEYLLLADPVTYPPLAEMGSTMHKLAGMRVNPANNGYHGQHGGTSPRLIRIEDKQEIPINLPEGAEIHNINWTVDGERFALTVGFPDHFSLYIGSINGETEKVEDIKLNLLMGSPVSWLPDQERLLIRRIPKRGTPPPAPPIPAGPEILEGEGASARSTYEARNLLVTSHDDALFDYYTSSELVILDPSTKELSVIGSAAPYYSAEFSPDGEYLLVERLHGPWSHEVAWWRFAKEIEVWDTEGKLVSSIASLPLANEVPIHGVPIGPRSVSWRPTASHTLYWVEALDGGDPVAEVDHRDRLMLLDAPFNTEPKEIFKTY